MVDKFYYDWSVGAALGHTVYLGCYGIGFYTGPYPITNEDNYKTILEEPITVKQKLISLYTRIGVEN